MPGVFTNPDLRCHYNVQLLFNRLKPKQASPANTTENEVEQVFNLTTTNTLRYDRSPNIDLGTIKIATSYKEVMNRVFLLNLYSINEFFNFK